MVLFIFYFVGIMLLNRLTLLSVF